MPVTYETRMERIPGVAAAMHWTWFNGIYQDEPKNFFGSFPVVPEELSGHVSRVSCCREDQKQAWLKTRTGAMVGRTLADRFKWKIGDRVQLKSPIWPRKGDQAWEFEIVGIYDGAEEDHRHLRFLSSATIISTKPGPLGKDWWAGTSVAWCRRGANRGDREGD